ncbi:MAG: YgjV family protein [Clostridia bacterium]|nr:YgjV family protein [Clostridia bacterium]
MRNLIIGQILGVIATILTFASYQANTKKNLLIIQSAATAFTCVSFLFLNALTGFALNIVCLLRNIVFYFQSGGSKLHVPTVIFLTALMIGVGALSWQGYVSLIPILALAANTVFMSLGKPQVLRGSVLVTSSMLIVYNILVFSMGGIANEAISIVSSVIGLVRFKNISVTSAFD